MGRSKKNWDHLVDWYGNYGIDIQNGIFPGSGNAPGIKGNKGETGVSGPLGDQGIKGAKGDRGYGQKGEIGIGTEGGKGEKGGPGGLFTFKGTITDESELPPVAEPGDVYYNTTTGELFAYDNNAWVNVGGIPAPVKGDKGEYGDTGNKGEPGLDGAEGAGGAEGDKGEKGENFDPLILDDYYPINVIDALIEHHHEPEKAFDAAYYKDQTCIVQNELVNFSSSDQQDEVYNPGIVILEQSCTIQDSPVSSARQIVVNYVTDNAGRLRGQGYQMIQHVFASELSQSDEASYWRLVRPNRNEFGDWHKTNFDEDNYYDKTEIDAIAARIGDQGLVFQSTTVENTEHLVLQDKNGAIDPTFVRFHTTGGITLTRNGNRLTFDGSPLAGQLLFLGLVGINEDVTVSVPSPDPGNYFIFKENGTDINTGETVAVGDWLIYGEDPQEWRHLPMGVSYGVAEVRIKGEKPYLTETGSIQFPELGFDTLEFERDFPAREGTIDVMNGSIWSMGDVKSEYNRDEVRAFSTKVDWNANLGAGEYAVSVSSNRVRVSDTDSTSAGTENFLEKVMDNAGYFIEATFASRSGNIAARPVSTETTVDGFILNFDNRSMPVFLSSEVGGDLSLTLCFDRTDVDNGDSLVWNEAEQKFIPGIAGEGKFVEREGDTMEGDLDMDGNDLNGLPNPPPTDSSAASKEWVMSLLGGLVQPGMVVFWPSKASTPSGWKKMDGGGYNVGQNPKMNAVLQGMEGYVSGKMPDWRGRFIYHTQGDGTAGVNGGKAGHFAEQRTANSSGGVKTKAGDGQHRHKWVRQNGKGAGTTSGAHVIRDKDSGAGNSKTTYYTDNNDTGTDGRHVHNIENWDAKTRPDSVAGYWIMKLD